MSTGAFIAPQQLEEVRCKLNGELCQALDSLTGTLRYGFEPKDRRNGLSRAYAELREAKSLLSYLKYPDPTEPIRTDELAWALKLVRDSYQPVAYDEWSELFNETARMLGIDLAETHAVPADLDRKLSNELALTRRAHALALTEAV